MLLRLQRVPCRRAEWIVGAGVRCHGAEDQLAKLAAMKPTDATAPHDWWVICLCAEWCGVCREWRDPFDQVASSHPEHHFAWVDVEDDAQAMGDVDVETFPTLLVAQGDRARFFGPVQPSAGQLSRLLASLLDTPASPSEPAQANALLKRLAATLLSKG